MDVTGKCTVIDSENLLNFYAQNHVCPSQPSFSSSINLGSYKPEDLRVLRSVRCVKCLKLVHGLKGMPQLNGDTAPLSSLDAGTILRKGHWV